MQSGLRSRPNSENLLPKPFEGYEGSYTFTAEPKGTKGVKDPVKAAITSIGNMTEEQKQELRDALK